MRHQKARTKLSRNSSLYKATMRDMAKAVLIRQRICTTKPKAKEARKLVDRLITLGKHGTLSAKRRAFAILCDHTLVSQLFTSIAGRFNGRQGGYTRIIPLGHRRGDNAQLAYLELTEKDKIIISKKKTEAQSKSEDKTKAPQAPEEKKKPTSPKTETHPPTHSKKDVVTKKPKSSSNILGNIKKMFTKKPPSSGGS